MYVIICRKAEQTTFLSQEIQDYQKGMSVQYTNVNAQVHRERY